MQVRKPFAVGIMVAIAAVILVGLMVGCSGDSAPPPAAQTSPATQSQTETIQALSDVLTPDEAALVAAGEAEPDPPTPTDT